jgi:phosphoribosylamine--glycine ligase
VTPEHLDFVDNLVVRPALRGLRTLGATFTGCLYPGLMIEGDDVQLLEFNARFGDPEAEVYMRLIEGDLFEIFVACALGKLDPASVSWRPGFAVSVVLCSPGYPGDYPTGLPISGIHEAEKLPDIVLFHSFTTFKDGQLVTNGGRVLNVTATGPTLDEALDKAYAAVKLIHFEGMHYRTDIGRRPA